MKNQKSNTALRIGHPVRLADLANQYFKTLLNQRLNQLDKEIVNASK